MLPLFRTTDMEAAARLLATHFRMVYVRASFNNVAPIRIRKDLLMPNKIYVQQGGARQIEKWKSGGLYISYLNQEIEVEHDAILFTECPRDVDLFDRACQATRSLAVVYQPPTWRPHDDTLKIRLAGRPARFQRTNFDRLERMKMLLEAAPLFTPSEAQRLRHGVLLPKVQPWCAPSPDESLARVRDTTAKAP